MLKQQCFELQTTIILIYIGGNDDSGSCRINRINTESTHVDHGSRKPIPGPVLHYVNTNTVNSTTDNKDFDHDSY